MSDLFLYRELHLHSLMLRFFSSQVVRTLVISGNIVIQIATFTHPTVLRKQEKVRKIAQM